METRTSCRVISSFSLYEVAKPRVRASQIRIDTNTNVPFMNIGLPKPTSQLTVQKTGIVCYAPTPTR